MDINDKVYEIGNGIYKVIKEELKVDFGIDLDDDAEADWNEFWDDFVLSRIGDEEDE
jgi:hypothetical protein